MESNSEFKDVAEAAKKSVDKPVFTAGKKGVVLFLCAIFVAVCVLLVTALIGNSKNVVVDGKGSFSLDQNVFEKTSVSWVHDGERLGDRFTSDSGTWVLAEGKGYFSDSVPGCSLVFSKATGDYGDSSSDRLDTERYRNLFVDEIGEGSESGTIWAMNTYGDRGLELDTLKFSDENGFHEIFFRHMPSIETLVLGKVSCNTEDNLTTVLTGGDAKVNALEHLGIQIRFLNKNN